MESKNLATELIKCTVPMSDGYHTAHAEYLITIFLQPTRPDPCPTRPHPIGPTGRAGFTHEYIKP